MDFIWDPDTREFTIVDLVSEKEAEDILPF